ncbi:MAG: hypothetical protein EPN17_03560 [Methylobacter sp.]|nr:MAG: hypothetical protein EPN17_03560 [Methylobacter sp.]
MNSKLIKLLVSVCIILSLLIAGEWLYASYSQRQLLTSISSAKPQDYKTDELPEIELSKQPEENYADLVARPLFVKGRRPVEEPSPEIAQAAAKPDSFDWQLTGIYSTGKTVSALFGRSKSKVAKDNHRKIAVGDDLDGWKLTEINTDRVMLKQGSAEKELLLRKPKLKTLLQPRSNNAIPTIPPPFPGSSPAPAMVPPPAPAPVAMPEPATDTTEDTTDETTEGAPEDEQQ